MSNLDRIFKEIGFTDPPPPPSPPRKWRPAKGPCGKSCYPSESAAKRGARALLQKNRSDTSRLRTYWCDDCHAWHISKSFK